MKKFLLVVLAAVGAVVLNKKLNEGNK